MIFQPLIWWRNGVLCYNDWMNDDEIDIYWCVPIMAFHINFKILNDPKCYKSHLIHVIINYVTLLSYIQFDTFWILINKMLYVPNIIFAHME